MCRYIDCVTPAPSVVLFGLNISLKVLVRINIQAILKHFKGRKRNESFREVVVCTVDITLKKIPRSNHNTQY
jgi:hypothetical protein